ncbi:MAG: 50S ribosomal protein L18 [Candidatus Nanohaloarchaeota archaeon QJJ-5]|nr:50S ribosomal protein L18 [Candidatus Nanohaloarchaeota archaeon QJJ-5]
MADGPNYQVPHRRRREQRTDYEQRLALLKSGQYRAVVRRSNNHTRVQLVDYEKDGDETEVSAHSSHLGDFGWDRHTGNLPASYLTGYLAGLRAVDDGIETAALDLGLQNTEHGTRLFAAVKGLIDAGVSINTNPSVFPDEDRMRGEHMADYHDDYSVETFEDVKEAMEDEY